jgi:hypothetical protein
MNVINMTLESVIMSRIRFIYYIRQTLRPVFIETVAILLAFVVGVLYAELGDVSSNFVQAISSGSVLKYITSAFMETEALIQTSISILVLATGYLSFSSIKNHFLKKEFLS